MKYLFGIKLKKRKPLNISQLIALVFLGIIITGAALLLLPVSSRNGQCCGIKTALFTATSSTCVTGLILADTWTQWSGFGQAVILTLIEIGGLGFMSAASIVIMAFRKKVNLSQRMVIAQSIGVEDMEDTMRVQKRMIFGSLIIQLTGALILTVRFWTQYGFGRALKLGVFHAVSAFCNAGFDILGFQYPGQSVTPYATDFVVCMTLSLLIIIGGLGFIVWDELIRVRSFKKLSVYSKLVLVTSLSLLLFGTGAFMLTEWNNPETMGNMNFWQKLIASFFQSTTVRTAGFAGIDQGALSEGGKAISIFLMLIGGSSGSTAGGLKTVTFTVLLLFLWSRIRNKDSVCVYNRNIRKTQVLNAITVFGVMIVLAFIGGTLICCTSPVTFTDALYEAVSALATVGLTTGITPTLTTAAHIMLMLYMYFGRVGILTISIGFLGDKQNEAKIKYANTDLLIG